jgi:hypothetical protein
LFLALPTLWITYGMWRYPFSRGLRLFSTFQFHVLGTDCVQQAGLGDIIVPKFTFALPISFP